MKRREAREHVFKLVFLKNFYKDEEYAGQCGNYLDHIPALAEDDLANASDLTEDDRRELLGRAESVILHSEEIDEMLNRLSEGWKTKRMNRVDLSLLRLAVYEIRYDDSVPEKVAVNEAVELAKTYGGEDSPAFVNAILGKIMKER